MLRYSIHGRGIELQCAVPAIEKAAAAALQECAVRFLPRWPTPIYGEVRPYDRAEVLSCMAPSANRVHSGNELAELYQHDEFFWRIDDHWGMCQLNIVKGHWRSWVLGGAPMGKTLEQAVMWPIAQLLRLRGLCMIPAAGIVRDGWGALVLCSFNIEPELTALVRAGFKVVGQNWTALREEAGRVVMLNLPGYVQRLEAGNATEMPTVRRVDLRSEFGGCGCERASCDAVLVVSPGRRPLGNLRPIATPNAAAAIRRAWPLAELYPHRRQGQFPSRMAHRTSVFDLQLSRLPQHVVNFVELAQRSGGAPDKQRNVA